jgi:hypothetical protein
MITAAISKEYKDFNVMDVTKAEEFLQKIVQVMSSFDTNGHWRRLTRRYLQLTSSDPLCFVSMSCIVVWISRLLNCCTLLQVEVAIPHPSGLELQQYLEDMNVQLVVDGGEQLQHQQGPPLQADASTVKPEQASELERASTSSGNGGSPAPAPAAPTPGVTPIDGAVRSTAAAVQQRRRRQQELLGEKGYTPAENKALTLIIQNGLLSQASPREVKRVLNQYRLSKHIAQQVGRTHLTSSQQNTCMQ